MNKFVVGLLAVAATAAIVGTALVPTAAQAQVTVGQAGPFEIVMLDETTCAMGAASETQLLMIMYSAAGGDDMNIVVANKNMKFQQGGGYYVDVVVDGKSYRWSGEGIDTGNVSGVSLHAANAVNVYNTLIKAEKVTFNNSQGQVIAGVISDSNFEQALTGTIACGLELSTPASSSKSKTKTK